MDTPCLLRETTKQVSDDFFCIQFDKVLFGRHVVHFKGSAVAECLKRDRRFAGSSLAGVTALCP